jgi:hypothetical protein
MVVKLTRLTHKIGIQLHLLAESCTICSSLSRRPFRKLLDTPSYEIIIFAYFLHTVRKIALLWAQVADQDILYVQNER